MIAFADTSYFVALHNRGDISHDKAVRFSTAHAMPILTTEFILLEVATFFARPAHRTIFLALHANLRDDAHTTILPASTDLFARGLALFAARPDKDWSLTGCISFEVMRDHGLTDALTADQHFVQAGFQALLA